MSEWQPIETAPLGRTIDVYVWGLLDVGLDDGFRWCEVKFVNAVPQRLSVWHESEPDDGDGYWRDYELSENGQFASHWMPIAEAPAMPDTPTPGAAMAEATARELTEQHD